MLFILSILGTLVFVLLFRKSIKKYCVPFYLLAAGISLFLLICKIHGNIEIPKNINKFIFKPLSKATISTALFTIVMYIGALNKKNPLVKKLFTIRGEMSIIACILALGHNLNFGYSIFPKLLLDPKSMDITYLIAACTSIVLILLMIPLMITSFITIRKRMSYKNWKRIQKTSYIFYMLIYLHVMLLFVPKLHKGSLKNIIAYSVIFLGYAVLRIAKYNNDRTSTTTKSNSLFN